jgi:hypothetical protein
MLWMRSSRVVRERLIANAEVVTVLGSIPSILRHSVIYEAADEAAFNYLHKTLLVTVTSAVNR